MVKLPKELQRKGKGNQKQHPKITERLGKTYIMVIDPLDFVFKHYNTTYEKFEFVICSESRFFRDSLYKLCNQVYELRRNHYPKNYANDIQTRMKQFKSLKLGTERAVFELVTILFDLAYYTAMSHDINGHLKAFSIIDGATIKYYAYFGNSNYNSFDILAKIQQKTHCKSNRTANGSCFEIYQLFN